MSDFKRSLHSFKDNVYRRALLQHSARTIHISQKIENVIATYAGIQKPLFDVNNTPPMRVGNRNTISIHTGVQTNLYKYIYVTMEVK